MGCIMLNKSPSLTYAIDTLIVKIMSILKLNSVPITSNFNGVFMFSGYRRRTAPSREFTGWTEWNSFGSRFTVRENITLNDEADVNNKKNEVKTTTCASSLSPLTAAFTGSVHRQERCSKQSPQCEPLREGSWRQRWKLEIGDSQLVSTPRGASAVVLCVYCGC